MARANLSMAPPRTMSFWMGSCLPWSLLLPRLLPAMMLQRKSPSKSRLLYLRNSCTDMTARRRRRGTSWSSTANSRARGGRTIAQSWGPRIGMSTRMSIQGYTILRYTSLPMCKLKMTKFALSRSICCTRATRNSGQTTQTCVKAATQKWTTHSFPTTCAHAGCLKIPSSQLLFSVISSQCHQLFISYSHVQSQE